VTWTGGGQAASIDLAGELIAGALPRRAPALVADGPRRRRRHAEGGCRRRIERERGERLIGDELRVEAVEERPCLGIVDRAQRLSRRPVASIRLPFGGAWLGARRNQSDIQKSLTDNDIRDIDSDLRSVSLRASNGARLSVRERLYARGASPNRSKGRVKCHR
jgi:hypothetical protein